MQVREQTMKREELATDRSTAYNAVKQFEKRRIDCAMRKARSSANTTFTTATALYL